MPYYPPPTSDGTGTGPQGPQGESAYQIALAEGFVGTEAEWLASIAGPKGDTGPSEVYYASISDFFASVEAGRGSGVCWEAVGTNGYTEAAASATDHHLTNAGGVKFYLNYKMGFVDISDLNLPQGPSDEHDTEYKLIYKFCDERNLTLINPKGHRLYLNGSTTIDNLTGAVRIDNRGLIETGASVRLFHKSAEVILNTAYTANPSRGDNVLSLTSVTGLSVGMIIEILQTGKTADTTFNYYTAYSSEIVDIDEGANTVTIGHKLPFNWDRTDATFTSRAFSQSSIVIDDSLGGEWKIERPQDNIYWLGMDVHFERWNAYTSDYKSDNVRAMNCVSSRVTGGNMNLRGFSYGVQLTRCVLAKLKIIRASWVRHVVDPSYWAHDTHVEDVISYYGQSQCNAHPCLDTHYKNVREYFATGRHLMRCAGFSLIDCRMESDASIGALNGNVGFDLVEYPDIWDDYNAHMERVEVIMPNANADGEATNVLFHNTATIIDCDFSDISITAARTSVRGGKIGRLRWGGDRPVKADVHDCDQSMDNYHSTPFYPLYNVSTTLKDMNVTGGTYGGTLAPWRDDVVTGAVRTMTGSKIIGGASSSIDTGLVVGSGKTSNVYSWIAIASDNAFRTQSLTNSNDPVSCTNITAT